MIKRVVVTGVGSRHAFAVVAAFKRRGWLVVGVDADFHPRHVNQFYLVSPGNHAGFVDELLMLVRRERTTLIIPTRDVDCVAVSSRSAEFRRLGVGVYLPDSATVETLVSSSGGVSALRRLGLEARDPSGCPPPLTPGAEWFEASVCRDARLPGLAVACSVHELLADPGAAEVSAERRKGEMEIEELAARAVQSLDLPGPATLILRRDAADGRLSVARVLLRPCEYAPLTDEVLDAFLSLWERDHPP